VRGVEELIGDDGGRGADEWMLREGFTFEFLGSGKMREGRTRNTQKGRAVGRIIHEFEGLKPDGMKSHAY
jgi:hypothetical protein